MTARQVAETYLHSESDIEDIVAAIQAFGDANWNAALELASLEATTIFSGEMVDYSVVDKESILRLKVNLNLKLRS